MKKNSLWQDGYKDLLLPTLNEDMEVDVLIIGGGMSGLSTAFYLKDSNINIAIIEKNKVAMGVSSLTTGKLNYLQNLTYSRFEKIFGFDIAKKYLDAQIEAIKLVSNNIKEYKIDCDYMVDDSFLFTDDEKNIQSLKDEADFLDRAGISNARVTKVPFKTPSIYAIKTPDNAVFHPVKYLYGLVDIILKKGIKIYENTRALTVTEKDDYYIVETTSGNIKAKYVVTATHYPFFIKPGMIPFRSHIDRSYVIAAKTDEIHEIDGISVDPHSPSLRYHNDLNKYIIYAGNTHIPADYLDPKEQMEKTMDDFKLYYNNEFTHAWMTHDVVTNDYMPFIGKVDDQNLFVATGFNKWGMTNGTIAGKVIADIILDNKNPYIELFDPKRETNIEKIKNTIVDLGIAVKTFTESKVNKNHDFYPANVEITTVDGVSAGIYTDDAGVKHIVKNTCPHMKCSLIFNSFTTTWDCPCHGSRFDIDGNVVQGPSVWDIKIDK